MKRLSIIIPLYNSAKWLSKCINSVLCQDVPIQDLEIICINDGSPDNSAEIARSFQQKYPQSIIVLDQENQGPSGARNNGIKHATGEYVCFVDPDDYVTENSYGTLLDQMDREQLDALRFNYFVENEEYQPISETKHPLNFNYSSQLMTGNEFIATRLQVACYIWTYIFRRRIITDNQIWCYVGDYYDDTPWLPRVLMKAERMNIVDIKVQHYIIRSNSLVRAKSPTMIERKLKGSFFLIDTLQKQMVSIMDKGVLSWYEYMLAHCTLGLISHAVGATKIRKEEIMNFIKEHNLLPLHYDKCTPRNKYRCWLMNINPRLYLFFLRLISK